MPECETIYSYENRNYCEYDELISQLFKAKEGYVSVSYFENSSTYNNGQINTFNMKCGKSRHIIPVYIYSLGTRAK